MSQANAEAYSLATRCRRARAETGRWPALAALPATSEAPGRDPWGRAWRLDQTADGNGATVRSSGADGVFDTADDVVSPLVRAPAAER